jgi:hypothetical protein
VRSLAAAIVAFVAGDDAWLAAAVVCLLGAAALLTHAHDAAWWVLPAGVPAALWISLARARRALREAGTAE